MSWKALFGKPPGLNGSQSQRIVASDQLIEPRALIQSHQAQLNALRLECGYEVSRFRQLIETPTLHVASWVHSLPATESGNHSDAGGLLRLAVETAAAAFRRSDGTFLGEARNGTLRDRDREQGLRYLAFLGGLLRGVGRCVTQMQVEAPSVRSRWNSLSEGLWPYRCRADGAPLELRWSESSDDGASCDRASVWIASRVLPPEVLLHLHHTDRSLPTLLLSVVAGEQSSELARIVEEARQSVVELDLSNRATRIRVTPMRMPVEHQLLEVMRALCREKWQVNAASAVVWCTDRGVFLDWKLASADIVIRLRAAGLAGVAQDADTLATLLLAQGVLVASPDVSPGHLVTIKVQVRGAPKQIIQAVKIAAPERIGLHLDSVDCIPVDIQSRAEGATSQSPVGGSVSSRLQSTQITDPIKPEVDPGPHPNQPAQPPSSQQLSMDRGSGSPLRRFGTAGEALQRLADLMTSQPPVLAMAHLAEGLAIGYPECVALLCPNPEQFVAACEAQGLLVPERVGGRQYVRVAPVGRDDLPRQYIVLAPRVLKYLGLDRQAS
jgi:hypothetical protein